MKHVFGRVGVESEQEGILHVGFEVLVAFGSVAQWSRLEVEFLGSVVGWSLRYSLALALGT